MPIRLLATDLDHTLLNHERKIQPENGEAIRRAAQAGLIVVLASGRNRTSMKSIAQQLGLNGPIIAANGADVLGEGFLEVAYHTIPDDVIDLVADFSDEYQVHLNLYTRDEALFLQHSDWVDVYASRVRSVPPRLGTREEAKAAGICKLLLMDTPERVREHRKILEPRLDPEKARFTESEPEYLEVVGAGVSKGASLENLCRRIGVAQEETAAIGDFLNDVEMVRWAKVGGAVANALPEVKAVAEVQVASNDDGGVAEFVDWILGNGRE